MRKPRIAIVRGKFLNRFEMQSFEPLVARYDMTAFGSMTPFHDQFAFPVVKLLSPMDLPSFPYNMPLLNRLCIDAHYLLGLEKKLKGFDLVHTAETYFHYTQQCLNAKRDGLVKKVIATVLENIPHNNEGIWGRKAFKARARRELDHIIALTQKTKEALLSEGADEKKISVISHFVDTRRFAPPRDWNIRLADEKRRTFTVLFVGRLEEYKGMLDLQDALERLAHDADLRDLTVRTIFVGDGSKRSALQSKISQLPKNWHSELMSATYDDMPKIYQSADVFVAPSKPTSTWDEQYCTALLEAQASGLPIVTTRTGGMPENVGEAAVLVPPGNVGEIARATKAFLLDAGKRTQYAQLARQRAVQVHDVRIGSRKIARLYERILST